MPNNYFPKYDFKKTQDFFTEYLREFKLNLSQKFSTLEINTPIFTQENNLEKKINRKIFFDSINDYETYFLNDKFESYFQNWDSIDKISDLNSKSEYFIFNNNNVIVRDKKVKEIFEIQKNIISGIFLQKEEEAKSSELIKIIYQNIFDTYQDLKIKYEIDFMLNKKINFFHKERELKNFRFFTEELILADILNREGIIVWIDDSNESYEIFAVSKINNDIFKLVEVKSIKLSSSIKYSNFKTNHFFEINITNIVAFLLEKFSTIELF